MGDGKQFFVAAAVICHCDLARSHIECRLKAVLKTKSRDIGVLWVRGYIGIDGNEKADKRAEFESILGEISGKDGIVTWEGVRASSRATRSTYRQE